MFPWFYDEIDIEGFDPKGRDEDVDQEIFD